MGPVSTPTDKPVRVALLGCGVVGSQVARLLHEQAGKGMTASPYDG